MTNVLSNSSSSSFRPSSIKFDVDGSKIACSSSSLVTPVRLSVVAPSVVVLGDDGKLAVNHTPTIRIDNCGKTKCNEYHALSLLPQDHKFLMYGKSSYQQL